MVDKWLEDHHEGVYNNYLFDDKNKLPGPGMKVTIDQLITGFNSMAYFREDGSKHYKVITLLARIYFSRMENGGFQERMFSTASNAQKKNQGSMHFDHLKRRTLLAQNKQVIRDGVI